MARERLFLEEMLAARIINRRLEAHARGQSAFITAAVGLSRRAASPTSTTLSVNAREGRWREALEEPSRSSATRCAPRRAPSRSTREIRNLRTGVDRRGAGRGDLARRRRAPIS